MLCVWVSLGSLATDWGFLSVRAWVQLLLHTASDCGCEVNGVTLTLTF